MSKEALKLALDALDVVKLHYTQNRHVNEAITAIKEALAQTEQEPVALKWQQAPVKTQWGDEMVVASVAIDKDHTVCLYCERDQTPKVDAMFAQRTWVGLAESEIKTSIPYSVTRDKGCFHAGALWADDKLKEKNT